MLQKKTKKYCIGFLILGCLIACENTPQMTDEMEMAAPTVEIRGEYKVEILFDPSGELRSETFYDQSETPVTKKHYLMFDTLRVSKELDYASGVTTFYNYHDNGVMSDSTKRLDGELYDIGFRWYDNGNLKTKSYYSDGKIAKREHYDEQGAFAYDTYYMDSTEFAKKFDE